MSYFRLRLLGYAGTPLICAVVCDLLFLFAYITAWKTEATAYRLREHDKTRFEDAHKSESVFKLAALRYGEVTLHSVTQRAVLYHM
jgi:hypothetical protein